MKHHQIELSGVLNFDSVVELREQGFLAIEAIESEKIIVDISKTEFIDSNGLGIILYYHTLIQKNGRELILLNSNPSPQAYMTRLLEFTQLTNVFKVITSLEAL